MMVLNAHFRREYDPTRYGVKLGSWRGSRFGDAERECGIEPMKEPDRFGNYLPALGRSCRDLSKSETAWFMKSCINSEYPTTSYPRR
jgi:hypothetical protein